MMKNNIFRLGFMSAMAVSGAITIGHAQAPGSVAVYGGPLSTVSVAANGEHTDAAESLYIGPGTYSITGTWNIYAKNVVIDPAAVFPGTGTGKIRFYNPSAAGGAPSATYIDGNASSSSIDLAIEHNNASGMYLTNIPFPADLTGAGFTNNNAASSLYMNRSMSLMVDGAHIYLGTGPVGDLKIGPVPTAAVTGYGPQRHVVTGNSILSHMVKESMGDPIDSSSPYIFPVGISSGDFTPMGLIPAFSSGPTMGVSVTNYAQSASLEAAPGEGMDRAWHAYANVAGPHAVQLYHNAATNGSQFSSSNAFVAQQQSPGVWSSGTPGSGTAGMSGTTMHSSSMAMAGSQLSANTWFTKTSDPVTPLPMVFEYFTGKPNGCFAELTWKTGSETGFSHFEVMASIDGISFETAGTVSGGAVDGVYSFTFRQATAKAYYKLKMVDMDGKYSYSALVPVTVKGGCGLTGNEFVVYPNPAGSAEQVRVRYVTEASRGPAKLWLCDALGRALYKQSVSVVPGSNQYTIPVHGLASGSYIIRLVFDGPGAAGPTPVKFSVSGGR